MAREDRPIEVPVAINIPQYRQAIAKAVVEYKTAVEAAADDLVYSIQQAEDGLIGDFTTQAKEARRE